MPFHIAYYRFVDGVDLFGLIVSLDGETWKEWQNRFFPRRPVVKDMIDVRFEIQFTKHKGWNYHGIMGPDGKWEVMEKV